VFVLSNSNYVYRLKRVEHTRAEFVEKLPPGKHSCKGVGRTMPNPAASLMIEDKLEVPLGKPVPSRINDTTLLYNEYPFYTFILITKFLFLIKSKLVGKSCFFTNFVVTFFENCLFNMYIIVY